jgi:hypothetical protein
LEDEDEGRSSASYDMSPKITLNVLGNRISDPNLIQELPQMETIEVKERAGTGSSTLSKVSMVSQASNHSSVDIQAENFEKKDPKKDFCTKKHLFFVHNEIVKSNKEVLKKLRKWNKGL